MPSKVAPRRSWCSLTELLLHSRSLYNELKMMDQQHNVDRQVNEAQRVSSPSRHITYLRKVPHDPFAVSPHTKPLVFRKTKRELEKEQREQAFMQQDRIQNKKLRVEEGMCKSINNAQLNSVQLQQWSCRRTAYVLRAHTRRRLQF
ncbi:hypothetical protein Plhal304r1_c019g0069451 [Plasmopara halstedii]